MAEKDSKNKSGDITGGFLRAVRDDDSKPVANHDDILSMFEPSVTEEQSPPTAEEIKDHHDEVIRSDEKEINGRSLEEDLAFLKPILGSKEIKSLEKFYIPPANKRLITLPTAGHLYTLADTHGNEDDFLSLIKFVVQRRLEGEDARGLYLGDTLHGLKARNHLDELLRDNLGSTVPCYADKSIDNLFKLEKFQRLTGDLVTSAIADHELVQIFPGFVLKKFGEDLTYSISEKLTPEQNEFLRSFITRWPVMVKTQNGWAFSHTGPAPMLKSVNELEKIQLSYSKKEDKSKFRAPPNPESDEYPMEQINWINDTLLGRLTTGKLELKEIRGKERFVRYFDLDEEYEEFRKGASSDGNEVKQFGHGHTGVADYIVKKGGKETHHKGVIDYSHHGRVMIMVTTEGKGSENMRNTDGRNVTGKMYHFDLSKPFGSMKLGSLGTVPSLTYTLTEEAHEKKIEKKKTEKHQKATLEERVTVGTYLKAFEDAVERRALPSIMLQNFKKNMQRLEKDLAEGKLSYEIFANSYRFNLEENHTKIPLGMNIEPKSVARGWHGQMQRYVL